MGFQTEGLEERIEELEKQLKDANKEIATLRMVMNHYGDVESENDELSEQLKEANEVIEFYGEKDAWEKASLNKKKASYFCAFINDDEEHIDTGLYIGGKRARAYLEKYRG